MKVGLYIIFALFPLISFGQLQDTVYLDTKSGMDLSARFHYYIDKTQKLGIDNFEQWSEGKFKPCESDVLRFDLTEDVIWLTITLKSTLQSSEDFMLEFTDPSLYSITLYRKTNSKSQIYKSGTSVPPDEKISPGNKNNFKLRLKPQEVNTLIFKVESKTSMTFSAILKHEDEANKEYFGQHVLLGAYYGILILLFCYSIFLYFTVEIRPFLFYALYVLSISGFTAAADGFLAKYFHQFIISLGGLHDILFFVLSNILGLAFMLDFLKVKKWSRGLYLFTISYMSASVVIIVLLFMISKTAMLFSSQVISLISLILFLTTGVKGIKNKADQAGYYLMAYVAFGVFIVIFTLSMFRLIPFSFWVQYSIHFGYGLSIIILSYGLVRRLYQVNQKVLEKEKEKKQIIAQKNKELELKVKERTAEIAKKEINLRSILDHTDNSIWLIDKDYKLIDFNKVFADLWKVAYGRELHREKMITELIPVDELRQQWKKRYDDSLAGEQTTYIDNYKIDGNDYFFEIKGFPIKDTEKITGVAYFSKDISERLKAENQLKTQNEMLKKVNKELDSFVYSASHDLKAPLASVLGLINLVKNEDEISQRQEYYSMMERSIVRLDTFIKDIIDYSRNERTEVQYVDINFDTMLSNVFHDLQYINGLEHIRKDINIKNNTTFKSDPVRIRVIIRNLLSNAIKYGCQNNREDKKITVNVAVSQSDAKIEITDYGDGIEEHHLPHVFKMFYRAHEQSAGTGLGLYIVKETVDKLNGTIEVFSKPKQGSTFTVIIPNN